MPSVAKDRGFRQNYNQRSRQIAEFLIDRQARNQSADTLSWYRRCLLIWDEFCISQEITSTEQVTSSHIRQFLVFLQDRGHTPGGVVTLYTGVKAFLNWFGVEYEPDNWRPLAKVKTPKRPDDPLEPLSLAHFKALIKVCPRRTFTGDRDRAMLYLLLDTGLRHQELTDLNLADVDIPTGEVKVRQGKGRKSRTVFVGTTTRRALMVYMRHRDDGELHAPMWIKQDGRRLAMSGIRQVVRRRAQQAGIPEPGMHAFRRAFAINCLRNGMDVITLQRLLGHADLSTIERYLKQVTDDLRQAHGRHGVVDNSL